MNSGSIFYRSHVYWSVGVDCMRGIATDRAIVLGEYILETGATVRAAAKEFQISKSTVHTAVTLSNGLCG